MTTMCFTAASFCLGESDVVRCVAAPAEVPSSASAPATAASSARRRRGMDSSPCREPEEPKPLRAGTEGVVHAPLLAQRLADLADGAVRPQRLAHGRQEVRVAVRGLAHGRERLRRDVRVAFRADARGALELARGCLRVDRLQLDPLGRLLDVAVDADDDALAALDLLLPHERRLLDLVLPESTLDRLDGAAELAYAHDQRPRA